jgi:hypothetical protein
MSNSILYLLEPAHLDLACPPAGDSEFVRELIERTRLIGEPACLKDAALLAI